MTHLDMNMLAVNEKHTCHCTSSQRDAIQRKSASFGAVKREAEQIKGENRGDGFSTIKRGIFTGM